MSAPETTVVVLRKRTGEVTGEVEGRLVAPGLAITPSISEENRYSLTHVPSGLAFIVGRCAEHIERAAQFVVAVGIDWTRDTDALVGDRQVKETAQNLINAVGYCYTKCDPLREGPTWQVRCDTCHWEWEDEYNEGPLDAKQAKRIARDHTCEPQVEISPPGDGNEWFAEWLVNEDGTIGAKAGTR